MVGVVYPPAEAGDQNRTLADMGLDRIIKKSGGKASSQAAREALQSLFNEPNADPGQRKGWLKALGSTKRYPVNQPKEETASKLHRSLATSFNMDKNAEGYLDEDVCRELQKFPNLQYLFAHGLYQCSILHTILDPITYNRKEFNFTRLKPLIRFLIRLLPHLPTVKGAKSGATPLFFVLKSRQSKLDQACDYDSDDQSATESNAEENDFLDDKLKAEILQFLCGKQPDGLGSTEAVESLALLATSSTDDSSDARHAIHAAIERDFPIPEDIVAKLSKIMVPFKVEGTDKQADRPCLEIPDRRGRTCLHVALTAPFTANKITWAKQLAKLQPGLLKTMYKYESGPGSNGVPRVLDMTPLQHLALERRLSVTVGSKGRVNTSSGRLDGMHDALNAMEEFLKCQCLEAFDIKTCESIMYTRENEKQVFLTLDDETICSELLEKQSSHYRLDKLLKAVHILNNNQIQWDDKNKEALKIANSWRCPGNTDLFMVFHWLKDRRDGRPGVKKVFEVMVEDLSYSEKGPHSDRAIVECLKELKVETWDWRRMDIPTEVIAEAAGEHVKTLFLYCSGLKAVLQSWSDTKGLVNLKSLEKVEVEVHQGLESMEAVRQSAVKFKDGLETLHTAKYKDDIEKKKKKKLEVVYNLVPTTPKSSVGEEAASSIKSNGEPGFEEQDWVRCMDEFADLMEYIETGSRSAGVKPIKVALIDDGVKTSYASLDENIHCGKSGWSTEPAVPKGSDRKKSTRAYLRNYNSSQTGHGTVMAYYILRVCPKAKLCVAKLDPQVRPGNNAVAGSNQQMTFSIESVTEAIKWAVREEVDIISMSWAIDPSDDTNDKRVKALRKAIELAAENNILLFCANPDRGPEYPHNSTYPKALVSDTTLFCIGAAKDDGSRWGKISVDDNSCDFFLPGVELGIGAESINRKSVGKPPRQWRKHSGSSVSCALGAGLAAMVLHCTLVSGIVSRDDAKWNWLKTRGGMSEALRSINVDRRDSSKGQWLGVRRLFGEAVKSSLDRGSSEMLKALQSNVVSKLVAGAPTNSG